MGSEWPQIKLSELTSKITKGTTPSKKDGGFVTSGVNFIKAECVTLEGTIDDGKFAYITEEVHEKYKRSQLDPDDILFSMAGIILGKTALVKKKHLPANTNQALALIRPIPKKVLPKYLHYFLQQRSVFHFVNNSTSQSAQPNINLQQIGNLDITIPPLPEQKAIAHILGSLDDKIELNRQMNETLEGMAQALFKSWFVDFDPVIDNALEAGNPIPEAFTERAETRCKALANGSANREMAGMFPDSFQETDEMGWIPEGWELGKVTDLADLNSESWSNKNHPDHIHYIDLANTKNGYINEVFPFRYSEAPSRARRVLKEDDTIIGTVRPGNRSFAYIFEDGLTGSTGFAVLRSKVKTSRTFIYLCLTQDEAIDNFAHLADGGAYPAIKPEVVDNRMTVIVDPNLMKIFDDHCYSIMKKIGQNQKTNSKLIELRDTLLPKLISGELRIDAAEKMAEKVLN